MLVAELIDLYSNFLVQPFKWKEQIKKIYETMKPKDGYNREKFERLTIFIYPKNN